MTVGIRHHESSLAKPGAGRCHGTVVLRLSARPDVPTEACQDRVDRPNEARGGGVAPLADRYPGESDQALGRPVLVAPLLIPRQSLSEPRAGLPMLAPVQRNV